MKVTLDHIEPIAKNIKTFWFNVDKFPRQIAGQFTEITLKHNNPDSRGERRWFTLSNSPREDMLSITTKVASKPSSFKKTLLNLKPGTTLDLADPMGDFVLPKDATIPLLFVAGGVGCTPFHSIVKYLNDTKQKRDIQMIYAANSLDEVAFIQLFETVDKFEIVLSDPSDEWDGLSGHLTADFIYKESGNGKRRIYLSGPEPMVEKLEKDLKNLGIKDNKIQTDFFPGYEPI